ncbi:unnamed protein product [Porites lobata]|uniref:RING-type domain-containing protein n=1 Tax=Porites lobata TaxID=104759 RepID=A0ABN8RXQ4_9CNID|nr:unnamed protein product [Porites lobata]
MTYTHVELETSTTEISEKLKIYEERLRAIEEMLVCSICWEVVQRPHTLVCGHTYCTHCIWKWEQRQKHVGREPWCPQCLICFNSTRLLLDNSRGTKSEVKPYPQNVMLGQVTQVVFSDKLSTSEEPGGDSRKLKVYSGLCWVPLCFFMYLYQYLHICFPHGSGQGLPPASKNAVLGY